MPFKSEKQRRYLWANEPEIARDWTDTYGSRIHKNEGGIMQAGVKNYLGKQKMVKAPLHWQSSPDHPKTELAYITQAEKDLLVKRDLHNSLHGGVNRGPAGIMSLNGWGSSDPGQNRAGADISAGMDRDPGHKGWSAPGGFTSPHAKSPAELKSLADRKGSSTVMPSSFYGNQSTNRGINFSFPGQNFMRNIHPLRWAGNLIDNPFVSGAWSFLTSPLSGMSNLRQGMTQQEWEDARNERIRNKRIENILGRKAPITKMTLKNLERLGYTGEMPSVGSSPKMMGMNNLGLYTDRVMDSFYPGKRIGQDQGYYGLGSRYDKTGIEGLVNNYNPKDIGTWFDTHPATGESVMTPGFKAKYIDSMERQYPNLYNELNPVGIEDSYEFTGDPSKQEINMKAYNVSQGNDLSEIEEQQAKLGKLPLIQMRMLERKIKAPDIYGKPTLREKEMYKKLREMDKEEKVYTLPLIT